MIDESFQSLFYNSWFQLLNGRKDLLIFFVMIVDVEYLSCGLGKRRNLKTSLNN